MEQIVTVRKYIQTNKYGKQRYISVTKDDKRITTARLIMMNFLHTNKIPRFLEVHHKNENSLDDNFDNLILMTKKDHLQLHNPREYKYGASRIENETLYHKNLRAINFEYAERQRKCCRDYYWKIRKYKGGT